MALKTHKKQTADQLTPHPYDMSQIPDSLCEDFASEQTLFEAQRPITQRFLESQAQALSEVLMTSASQVRFKLPDEVVVDAGSEGVRFLFASGKPLREPVAWSGPIVMNTQEELRLAFDELNKGTFLKH